MCGRENENDETNQQREDAEHNSNRVSGLARKAYIIKMQT